MESIGAYSPSDTEDEENQGDKLNNREDDVGGDDLAKNGTHHDEPWLIDDNCEKDVNEFSQDGEKGAHAEDGCEEIPQEDDKESMHEVDEESTHYDGEEGDERVESRAVSSDDEDGRGEETVEAHCVSSDDEPSQNIPESGYLDEGLQSPTDSEVEKKIEEIKKIFDSEGERDESDSLEADEDRVVEQVKEDNSNLEDKEKPYYDDEIREAGPDDGEASEVLEEETREKEPLSGDDEMGEEDIEGFERTMRSPEGNIDETITSYSPNRSPARSDEDDARPSSPVPDDHPVASPKDYVGYTSPLQGDQESSPENEAEASPPVGALQEPYSPPQDDLNQAPYSPPDEQPPQQLSPPRHIIQPETPEDSNGPFDLQPVEVDNSQDPLGGPKTPEAAPPKSPTGRPQTPPLPGPRTPTEPRPLSTEPSVTPGDQSFESATSEDAVPPFVMITENEYVSASKQRSSRDKKMVCGCEFIAEDPSTHCTDTCLNKVLMIECNSRCPCGDLCKNKKFQNADYAKTEPFYTGNKGWGLKAAQDIIPGDFVMEYCGEVVNQAHFKERMEEYGKGRARHYYFMTISKDEIIDAHHKGNLSRFINHSCDPNCETQKWRVNGVLRIGFFAIKSIKKGAELSFDYQYQRFGDDVQTCYCGTDKCRGTLGEKLSDLARPSSKPSADDKDKKIEAKKKDSESLELSLMKITKEDGGLSSPDNALQLSRLMVQTDSMEHRQLILKTIQATTDATALKRFLTYQGLNILWSWMVDVSDYPALIRTDYKLDMIKVLRCLPISTKNAVEDSKTIKVLKKWVDNEQSSNSSQADSSEEGTTEEPETDADRNVIEAGQLLLHQWSQLKEVFKIPKKEKKQSEPRHNPPAAFSLSSMLANYSDRDETPPKTVRKIELSHTDYELPVSFGSTRDRQPSSERERPHRPSDHRDNKRRRDDHDERSDKRARDDTMEWSRGHYTHESRASKDKSADDLENIPISQLREKIKEEKRDEGGRMDEQKRDKRDEKRDERRRDDSRRDRRDDRDRKRDDDRGRDKNDDRSRFDRRDYSRRDDRSRTRDDSRGSKVDEFGRDIAGRDSRKGSKERHEGSRERKDRRDRSRSREKGRQSRFERNTPEKQRAHSDKPTEKSDHMPREERKSRFDTPEEPKSFPEKLKEDDAPPFPTSPKQPAIPPPDNPTERVSLSGPHSQRMPYPPFNPRNAGSFPRFAGSLPMFKPNFDVRGGQPGGRLPDLASVDQSVRHPTSRVPEHPSRLMGDMGQRAPHVRYRGPGPDVRMQRPSYDYRPQQRMPYSRPQQSWTASRFQSTSFQNRPEQGSNLTQSQGYMPPQRMQQQPTPHVLPPHRMPQHALAPAPRFPPTNVHTMPTMQQDIFKQISEHAASQPAGLLVPPAMAFPPTFQGMFNAGNVAPSLPPSSSSVSKTLPTGVQPALPKEPEPEKKIIVKPPPEPKSSEPKLPPHWRTAKDSEGKMYYYHAITRETQWDPPSTEETTSNKQQVETPASPVQNTPKKQPPPTKKKREFIEYHSPAKQKAEEPSKPQVDPVTKRAIADFKSQLAKVVVNNLGKYNKVDCKEGRIMDSNDFKYLARKLTHGLTEKEMQRKSASELCVTDSLKQRVRIYISSYMSKFGPIYHRT